MELGRHEVATIRMSRPRPYAAARRTALPPLPTRCSANRDPRAEADRAQHSIRTLDASARASS